MKSNLKRTWRILIIFGTLFLSICLLLLLIFNEGKKSYKVTFDLDGGILISGSLEQYVVQGQDAIPPTAAKDGAYLRGWSRSYQKVTKNIVVTAIWEYETTAGIIYADSENQNFTEIIGSYPYLAGDVYLGAYYDNKKILGIGDEAFINRTGIKKVYLLNGLVSIGERAFEGCTSLTGIAIPASVTHIEKDAFKGCESLETLILNEGLIKIESGAFSDCKGLKEVIIPESVTHIDEGAFAGCEELVIKVKLSNEDVPEGWANGWFGDATVEWNSDDDNVDSELPIEDEETEETDENDNNGNNENNGNGENNEADNSQEPDGGE